MRISKFAYEFGMAYRNEPYTRQHIYKLIKDGRIKTELHLISGTMQIPDDEAWKFINMYREAHESLGTKVESDEQFVARLTEKA